MAQNHVIDPKWFWDAIDEFEFGYDWYPQLKSTVNDLGMRVSTFDKKEIRGSLQTQGSGLRQSVSQFNTVELKYDFYCKSIYRLCVGDFISYKGRWLHCDGVWDYDEYGVRHASLTMVNLNDFKDFKEYLKYLEGSKII